ncbi:MAG TPA: PIN domain-containing protein [Solirubrobacteraceae bacterium]|nr:PIN domain-containing protein [Solirubrobacteraceae bacterium]
MTETSGTWAAGVEASLPANAGTNPRTGLYSVVGTPASTAAGVTDKLTCAPSAVLPCRATETLTTTETTRGGRPIAFSASTRCKSRKVIVATKTVMIRPGKKVTVTVKLNPAGRKLLAALPTIKTLDSATLLRALEVYEVDRLDFADAYLVAQAQATGVEQILSFDKSIDRIGTITRHEP